MIGRQFHDKGSGVAGKHLGFLQHDAGNDDGSHTQEIGAGSHPGRAAEDGACNHGDEWQLGAAGNEGGGHDGHAPVPLILDGAGGHDAGDAAAGTNEHGNEGFAGQAELPENPVHDKGDPGHVAAGLQEGQEEEQDQNLGDEAQHSANTGDNAVQDETLQPVSAANGLQALGYQHGDPWYPHAVILRVGGSIAVFVIYRQSSSEFRTGGGDFFVGHGLFVYDQVGCSFCGRELAGEAGQSGLCSSGIKILRLLIQGRFQSFDLHAVSGGVVHKASDNLGGSAKFVGHFRICAAANAK